MMVGDEMVVVAVEDGVVVVVVLCGDGISVM